MRRIDTKEELKAIQLNALLALNDYCTRNSIKYSLAAGSLIGAIRHKGFIPWDDDIDVYLLRSDYNILISHFPKVFEEYYILISKDRDSRWLRTYSKLYDNRTVMKESARFSFEDLGVGIDIFPIDDVPDNPSEWKTYNKRRMLLRDILFLKTMKFSSKRGFLKNFVLFLSRIALFPLPYKFLIRRMDFYSQKNNNKGYSTVYENCLGIYNSPKPWLKKDFDQVIDAEFEGHKIKIMVGYNDYLTTIYGDYMTLPPVEKQISHHSFFAYWK